MPPRPLSIVIPAYNEAERIGPTLKRVGDHLAKEHPGSEILVVDDGSRDDTRAVVEAFAAGAAPDPEIRCLVLPENRGKGAAVKRGVLAATRPYVLFTDADLSTPIEEVERLFEALEGGARIAIGSRSVDGANVEVHQPLYRMLMGKTFNKIMRAVTFLPFIDSQCGFKLFHRADAQRLFEAVAVEGFAFDVEVLWLARRTGMRVAEVPVRWLNDPRSTVSPVGDSARMLRDVLRLRWIHRGREV